MAEETFWGKATRTVKSFFAGAVNSIPTSLMVSGASIGISAALGNLISPEMDFLSINNRDAASIAMRFTAATLAGMGINGGVSALQAATSPGHSHSPDLTTQSRASTPTRSSPGQSMNITPPFTPHAPREPRARD